MRGRGFAPLLLLLGVATSVPAYAVTFADGVFDDAQWTGTVLELGPTGGTASASQIPAGGNPAEYREIQATVNPTAGTGQNGSVSLYSIYTLAVWDPAAQGAIASVDFSIDTFQTSSASGGTVTAALLQDGTLFTGSRGRAGPEMDWTNKEILDLAQNEFLEIDETGSGVSQPDFSASGGPITFGFRYVISTPVDGLGGSRTAGFDNWTVTVNPVSGPSLCAASPRTSCLVARKAALSIVEKKPGKERLKATLAGLTAATTLADLGDPVAGSTRYDLCLYDATPALVAELSVDRAAQRCGRRQKPCWKFKGKRGYAYKDPDASADGVRKLAASAGPEGKGKLTVAAANNDKQGQRAMPTGIAASLRDASSATAQLVVSGGRCFEAMLSDVKRADGLRFKAKRRR